MPTVIGSTKADFDRSEMEKRGQLKPKKSKSKYEIKPNYDENMKRNGWAVHEGDFVHDVYPTKKYAQDMISKWEAMQAKQAMENK